MFDINFFAFSSFLLRVLRPVVDLILCMIFPEDKKPVVHTENDLLKLSIVELTTRIRSKKIKCVDVIQQYIDSAKNVNTEINAIAQDMFYGALKEAEKLDIMCGSTLNDKELEEKFPLLGVPFSVKQVIAVQDMPNHLASVVNRKKNKDSKYEADAKIVQLLKNAGAIPILHANTPEKSIGWETFNHIYGRTKNPYDLSRTPGGSSGGDAAMVAAHGCVFGIGSDFAGSIRLPAHFCGIYGHKSSARLISIDGVNPKIEDPNFETIAAAGPLAKTADDLELIVKIMSGENSETLTTNLDLPNIKVLYFYELPKRWFLSGIESAVKQSIQEITKHFISKQMTVKPVNTDDFYYLPEVANLAINYKLKFPNFLENAEGTGHSNFFIELLKCIVWRSKFTFGNIWFEFLTKTKGLIMSTNLRRLEFEKEKIEKFLKTQLEGNVVLLLPTYPTSAVKHYGTFARSNDAIYMTLANAFGLPCTQVPVGFNKNGLPFGIQILAAHNNDGLCLKVAKEIELYLKSCKISSTDAVEVNGNLK